MEMNSTISNITSSAASPYLLDVLSDYTFAKASQWMRDNTVAFLLTIPIYIILAFILERAMRNHKGWELRSALAAWNGALAIFSFMGVYNIAPVLFSEIWTNGFTHSYAHTTALINHPNAGRFAFIWYLSKLPEYVDTVFIVLRKRPLVMLHWYHHAASAFSALYIASYPNPYGVWVAFCNYSVHVVMYTYFALSALKIRMHPALAQIITAAQMSQFALWNFIFAHLLILQLLSVFTGSAAPIFNPISLIISIAATNSLFAFWLRFYYVEYYLEGGRKYSRHQEMLSQETLKKLSAEFAKKISTGSNSEERKKIQ